jgi:hypothetical protein
MSTHHFEPTSPISFLLKLCHDLCYSRVALAPMLRAQHAVRRVFQGAQNLWENFASWPNFEEIAFVARGMDFGSKRTEAQNPVGEFCAPVQ